MQDIKYVKPGVSGKVARNGCGTQQKKLAFCSNRKKTGKACLQDGYILWFWQQPAWQLLCLKIYHLRNCLLSYQDRLQPAYTNQCR